MPLTSRTLMKILEGRIYSVNRYEAKRTTAGHARSQRRNSRLVLLLALPHLSLYRVVLPPYDLPDDRLNRSDYEIGEGELCN